ncbi:hypothetical protein C8Q80DRAFT_888258 [Daedaleopsis nitida]|nr:hypothetical protein C8Q80DRAFT_888258 [Daedaleopsis nitida]
MACTFLNHSYDALDVTCNLAWACLIVLRGYGIWNRERKAILLLAPFALVMPVVTFLYAISVDRIKPTVGINVGYCSESIASWIANVDTRESLLSGTTKSLQQSTHGILAVHWVIPHLSTLGAECILVSLTWCKTLSIKRELKKLKVTEHTVSVASFLFRDGTLHFLLALSSTVAITIWAAPGTALLDTGVAFQFWLSFGPTLRVMVLYRFILALRGIYFTDTHECISTYSTCLHFQPDTTMDSRRRPSMASSFMGNIGATVMDDSELEQEWFSGVEEVPMFSNNPLEAGMKDAAMKV